MFGVGGGGGLFLYSYVTLLFIILLKHVQVLTFQYNIAISRIFILNYVIILERTISALRNQHVPRDVTH